MVKHMLFPNIRGNMLLFCFVLMFCLRIENNYFVVHSESSNVKCLCFCHLNTTPRYNRCKFMVDL